VAPTDTQAVRTLEQLVRLASPLTSRQERVHLVRHRRRERRMFPRGREAPLYPKADSRLRQGRPKRPAGGRWEPTASGPPIRRSGATEGSRFWVA
jgi:hypothetical protein